MIQIIKSTTDTKVKYQYYMYSESENKYVICTNYNEPMLIKGKSYTPVDGAVELDKKLDSDTDGRNCDITKKLNEVSKDLQTTFDMLISMKGWWE